MQRNFFLLWEIPAFVGMTCLVLFLACDLHAVSNNIVPAVVVKAPQIKRYVNASPKIFITQQQLKRAGVVTLSEALQNLGGVQLRDITGNGSQTAIAMRGFGTNATSNTLLLVNGIPLTNPDLAPPNLNIIPPQEVEYIEIIAGSESVLYGDQAVAGIVNIVTTSRGQENIEAACSAGSYQQIFCYAALSNSFKHFKYNMMAANNRTNNYRDHNKYQQSLLLGMFDYAYGPGHARFNYNLANERMDYPGALTAFQVRQNRRQANNDIDFFTDWGGFYHLQLEHHFNPSWKLITNIARREMHGHGVLTSPFGQSRLIYFLKPELKACLGTAKINMGLDVESDYYHLSSLYGLTNNHQQKYGLFLFAVQPINDRLAITLGARGAQQNDNLQSFTNNNTINRALATTLAFSYQLTPCTSIYLRRAESFRFPKADENAFAPIGVASLRTQRGIAYEGGFGWDKVIYAGKLSFYQINLRDEIAFDPTQTPQQPFGANRNLAPTLRRGLMLTQKNNISKQLSVSAQYNYVNARFQSGANADNRIPLVAENILLTNINYKFLENWSLYAEAVYTSSQFSANDDANVAGKIGGYTVFNVNLRYQLKKFSASFRVNNIFNKNYYFYTVYQTNVKTVFFYPAPERNFLLTLKYNFL